MKINLIFKKALLLLIAPLFAISCSQEKSEAISTDETREVTFTATISPETRGTMFSAEKFDHFKISAYNWAKGWVLLDVDVDVVLMEDGTFSWSSTEAYEIPTTGKTTVYAYADFSEVEPKETGITFSKDHHQLNYVMPDDITKHPHLLLNNPTVLEEGTESLAVNLDFFFGLSTLNFSVKGDYKITSLSIKNFAHDGYYDFGETTWTNYGVKPEPFNVDIKEIEAPGADANAVQLIEDNGYIFVVPQTVANFIIIAEVEDNGETVEKTLEFSSKDWKNAMTHTYTINTGTFPNVEISVEVEESESSQWTDGGELTATATE